MHSVLVSLVLLYCERVFVCVTGPLVLFLGSLFEYVNTGYLKTVSTGLLHYFLSVNKVIYHNSFDL